MTPAAPTDGEIVATAAYPLDDFKARTRLGAKSIRRMKSEGLRVTRVGRRSYIIGSDFLEFLEKSADRQRSAVESPNY